MHWLICMKVCWSNFSIKPEDDARLAMLHRQQDIGSQLESYHRFQWVFYQYHLQIHVLLKWSSWLCTWERNLILFIKETCQLLFCLFSYCVHDSAHRLAHYLLSGSFDCHSIYKWVPLKANWRRGTNSLKVCKAFSPRKHHVPYFLCSSIQSQTKRIKGAICKNFHVLITVSYWQYVNSL